MLWFVLLVVSLLWCSGREQGHHREPGEPYGQLTEQQSRCELEGLTVGSLLADNYNNPDEETEWDARMHTDYLTQHLGYFGVIAQGTWGSKGKTTYTRKSAHGLQVKGRWLGQNNVSDSAYWPLANEWFYLMGDSTLRQVFATFASPGGNSFEQNSKEWSRSRCMPQYPHRKRHPEGNYPEEGWSGKCGNNEVTCHLAGYGSLGKITFDWKHFPFEDYDEWLFGEQGMWGLNTTDDSKLRQNLATEDTGAASMQLRGRRGRRRLEGEAVHTMDGKTITPRVHKAATTGGAEAVDAANATVVSEAPGVKAPIFLNRRPDIFVPQTGLHVCFHAYRNGRPGSIDEAAVKKHETGLPKFFKALKKAINRPMADGSVPEKKTIVVISTAGRIHNGDLVLDNCIWNFNRVVAKEAHKAGFPVFEREEIERRLLLKSDSFLGVENRGGTIKPNMHLPAPGPQIVATALAAMIGCLKSEKTPKGLRPPKEGYIAMH